MQEGAFTEALVELHEALVLRLGCASTRSHIHRVHNLRRRRSSARQRTGPSGKNMHWWRQQGSLYSTLPRNREKSTSAPAASGSLRSKNDEILEEAAALISAPKILRVYDDQITCWVSSSETSMVIGRGSTEGCTPLLSKPKKVHASRADRSMFRKARRRPEHPPVSR